MANGLLNNLKGYWKADEASAANLADTVASNTLVGQADLPGRVAGKINNAATFDTVNKISETTFDSDLDFRQNPMVSFSVSLWFNLIAIDSGASVWLCEAYDDAAADEGGWGLVYRGQNNPDDMAVFYRVDAVTTEALSIPTGNLSTGTWYHIVAGFDAAAGELFAYFNGTKYSTAVTGQIMTTGNVEFTVGGWQQSSVIANAHIDEIGVWAAALTQSQADALYNSGSGLPHGSFDSGAAAVTATSRHDVPYSDPSSFFQRHLEVTGHLLATPSGGGDAAITVVYIEEPL
jgi:hypothetical protein